MLIAHSKRPLRGVLERGFSLLLAVLFLMTSTAQAQNAVFKDEELDQMLAPIALYPDALLSQILMASTYPLDVKDAAAWSKARPDLKGDAAVKQVQNQAWEPSVQSLVAFPQVLSMMGDHPADVQRMGDAFLADPGRVMDRVQYLRRKAQEAGNLKSSEQQTVIVKTEASKQVIVVEPAKPDVIYVPVYQPTVVYGTWAYPSYPPVYWPPPPYYYPPTGGAFVAVENLTFGPAKLFLELYHARAFIADGAQWPTARVLASLPKFAKIVDCTPMEKAVEAPSTALCMTRPTWRSRACSSSTRSRAATWRPSTRRC
jgi:hypothetical protein